MKRFRFARFITLLVRVLEISIIAALALRWFDATLGFWYKITLPRPAYDAALNFSFLVIVLLLLATLWLLFTRQPPAWAIAMRTSIYIVAFFLSPSRLGVSPPKTTQGLTMRSSERLAVSAPRFP
jgi:hypothetical protein